MNGGSCDGSSVILAPRSIASRMNMNMNKVLVRRNDENSVNKQFDPSASRRIVMKVKRKSAVNVDNTKCNEIRRTALSHLNNATQAFVQFSTIDEGTIAKVLIKSASNHRSIAIPKKNHAAEADVNVLRTSENGHKMVREDL